MMVTWIPTFHVVHTRGERSDARVYIIIYYISFNEIKYKTYIWIFQHVRIRVKSEVHPRGANCHAIITCTLFITSTTRLLFPCFVNNGRGKRREELVAAAMRIRGAHNNIFCCCYVLIE